MLLIGLDLSLRDSLHEQYGGWVSAGVVLAAGGLSYLVNPAAITIATASVVAFTASGLADSAAYQLLGARRKLVKMNGSNLVGAAIDSLVFPTLAFGVLMPQVVLTQFAAKVVGGAFFAYVLCRRPK